MAHLVRRRVAHLRLNFHAVKRAQDLRFQRIIRNGRHLGVGCDKLQSGRWNAAEFQVFIPVATKDFE